MFAGSLPAFIASSFTFNFLLWFVACGSWLRFMVVVLWRVHAHVHTLNACKASLCKFCSGSPRMCARCNVATCRYMVRIMSYFYVYTPSFSQHSRTIRTTEHLAVSDDCSHASLRLSRIVWCMYATALNYPQASRCSWVRYFRTESVTKHMAGVLWAFRCVPAACCYLRW